MDSERAAAILRAASALRESTGASTGRSTAGSTISAGTGLASAAGGKSSSTPTSNNGPSRITSESSTIGTGRQGAEIKDGGFRQRPPNTLRNATTSNNNDRSINSASTTKRPYHGQDSSSSSRISKPQFKASTSPVPTTGVSTSSSSSGLTHIIINGKRQKDNPVVKLIRGVGWHFDDIVPDFIVGTDTCVLILCIQYHNIKPDYIFGRVNRLGNSFAHRILLVVVDVENPDPALKSLTKMAMYHNLQIITCWSNQEAAYYLALLKSRENAAPTAIQGQKKELFKDQLVDVMSKVRGVNKTDAVSMVMQFGTFKNGIRNSDKIEMVNGWGEIKASRFRTTITEPFIYNRDYESQQSLMSDETVTEETPENI